MERHGAAREAAWAGKRFVALVYPGETFGGHDTGCLALSGSQDCPHARCPPFSPASHRLGACRLGRRPFRHCGLGPLFPPRGSSLSGTCDIGPLRRYRDQTQKSVYIKTRPAMPHCRGCRPYMPIRKKVISCTQLFCEAGPFSTPDPFHPQLRLSLIRRQHL